MIFRFAIVGSGLTGTSMLCQLVEALREEERSSRGPASDLVVLVFEKGDTFGPGFPHDGRATLPEHITNMCARDMGIRADRPGDFEEWMASRHVARGHSSLPPEEAGWPGEDASLPCRHYPRARMGEYLAERFREAVAAADRLGVRVKLFPATEVVDLREEEGRVRVTARHGPSGDLVAHDVDRVLLATGHWVAESGRDGWFPSPWPARRLLEGIPPGASVGVLGTSLSAIETVITLTSDGTFASGDGGDLVYTPPPCPRTISLYSRHGLFPKVRGRIGRRRNRHLTAESLADLRRASGGQLFLDDVFRLLDAELTEAYGERPDWGRIAGPPGSPAEQLDRALREARSGDGPQGEVIWQTVLHGSFDLAREIYLGLSPQDRERFDRDHATLFFLHAATQPAINARKLLALLRSGTVTAHRLGISYRIERDRSSGRHVFRFRSRGGGEAMRAHDRVVDARGQRLSLDTDPAELYRSLRRSGTIVVADAPPSFGAERRSVRIDPVSHRVLTRGFDRTIRPSRRIYAVGAMTRGQIIDVSMARGLVRSTAGIARELAGCLRSRGGGE